VITKASLIVQYNDDVCAVVLDGIDLDMMINVIASLSSNGKLRLLRLPDSVKLSSMTDLFTTGEI